jgi:hypothetical protein
MDFKEPSRRRVRCAFPALGSIVQDVRYTARTLHRNPGFTLLAVLILAIGIGANTAVFSVLSAVLLRRLPFEQADRLVVLSQDFRALGPDAQFPVTPAAYVDWKNRSRSFEDMAALALGGPVLTTYNLTGKGEPEKLPGARATTNLFSLLGLNRSSAGPFHR